MEPGKLTRRVQVQAELAAEAADRFGQPIPRWGTIAWRYAAIRELSGRELFAAREVQADVTTEVRCRYVPPSPPAPEGLTPKMRLRYRGTLYNIESVTDVDMAHRELVLLCHKQA